MRGGIVVVCSWDVGARMSWMDDDILVSETTAEAMAGFVENRPELDLWPRLVQPLQVRHSAAGATIWR